MHIDNPPSRWDEDTSKNFLDYSKYFVPQREQQMQMMVDLLKSIPKSAQLLELCCGEGLQAEQILQAYPAVQYYGLDGSALMLEKAAQRLKRFSDRVRLQAFDLQDHAWRKMDKPVQAVFSSLAIHHLEGQGKQKLFKNVYTILDKGGVFIIADMVEPVTGPGRLVAADAWDRVVLERSLEVDGTTTGLEFFLREHWNTYRYPDPEDIDHPSSLYDQLKWLEQAGFIGIDVHFMHAGHALFSGWKFGVKESPAMEEVSV